jgi:hypothetical protein
LVLKILCVYDPVSVVTLLPYVAGMLLAYGEGEAAFDELSAAFDGDV